MLIGVWVGGVAVAAWRVLPAARRDGVEINAYLDQLSFAATLALAGIVASGAGSSWQRVSAPSDLLAHPWGMLLSLKLGLVAMAALMGGWNRCIGFPRAKRGASDPALLVLRIESLVLACILVLAAALTAQQPPTV
jgi:copper resistance protein D